MHETEVQALKSESSVHRTSERVLVTLKFPSFIICDVVELKLVQIPFSTIEIT